MKTTHLTRLAAALVALAVAAPALPCGLMKHEAAATTTPPVVAETPKADAKAQPPKAEQARAEQAAEQTVKQEEKKPSVAKN